MARKKNEFRPDTVRQDVLGKVLLTKKQSLRLLRWLLFSAVCLGGLLVQDVVMSRFSGSAPGIHTIPLITGIAVVTAIFRQAYLRKGFFTLMLCVAAALFAYETITFSIGLFLGQTLLVRYGAFVISTILTLLPVPALYPVLLYIGQIGGETWKE